jgi:hypothetical protein
MGMRVVYVYCYPDNMESPGPSHGCPRTANEPHAVTWHLAQFHGTCIRFFQLFYSFPNSFFLAFQLFRPKYHWRDLKVEMRIWCIKIGIVFALHCEDAVL